MRKLLSFLLSITLIASMAVCSGVSAASIPASLSSQDGEPQTPPQECSHTFGAWSAGDSGHSRTCSACGAVESAAHSWVDGEITQSPTCTDSGSKTLTCSVCGASTTQTIPAAGHAYGPWVRTDDNNHKRVCNTCGVEETAAHAWGYGQVITPATCQSQGERIYTCNNCGAKKSEVLPITDHSYSQWEVNQTSHFRSCTVCGKVESGAHSWDGGSVQIPATCKEEGAFVYLCSGCGGALVEVIPKLTTHTYDTPCDPDCNVCGALRDVQHKFSTAWSKNSLEHWHVCTLCGEKADIGKHYPGPAATEEKAQLCLTCGYVLTAKLNHTHKFSDKLTFDETGHWYACDGCEEQKDFEAHSYDDPCDTDCNICGYITDTAHDFAETWSSDETGHWSVCTLCGEKSEVQAHVPNPSSTEDEGQFCSVCGFALASAPHEHDFSVSWEQDETSHWQLCECGESSEKSPHTWDAGVENGDGTITYTCTQCQMQRTEELPASLLPWVIVLIVLLVALLGCTGALIWYLRRGHTGKFTR